MFVCKRNCMDQEELEGLREDLRAEIKRTEEDTQEAYREIVEAQTALSEAEDRLRCKRLDWEELTEKLERLRKQHGSL